MPSYEDRFYRQNPTPFDRIRRNVELIRWLAGHLYAWFIPGRRIRKAYRQAQRNGESIVLENYFSTEQK